MTPDASRDGPADTAFRAAEIVRAQLEAPWEIFGERAQRYEVHLNGTHVELVRGPVVVEGVGLRVFRARGETTGVGLDSTTDLTAEGLRASAARAERGSGFSVFPAKSVALPSGSGGRGPHVETVDSRIERAPEEALEAFTSELLGSFDGVREAVPSFGSIRATLSEATLTNSEGLHLSTRGTRVEFELAVKSEGGAEGRPAGEFWVNQSSRELPTEGLAANVRRWARLAHDMRKTESPPTGPTRVVFPPEVLAEIVPDILGYRFSGSAVLRKLAPELGSEVGAPDLRIEDDGLLPFGLGSDPFDDEGTPQTRRPLIENGKVAHHLYDTLHASALDQRATGNAKRGIAFGETWHRFHTSVQPFASNLVIGAGRGGRDEELIEGVEDGLWLEQLGAAFPDAFSGSYGGEIRAAYRIRHGKLAEAVRGGTVGGMVLAGPEANPMLRRIAAYGSESRTVGLLSSPTLVVDGVTVAGE